MQLVEQIRVKRQEAQSLLLSRKRKLAELYSVTSCPGRKVNQISPDLYKQQLQAFQDVNDLQYNRAFDENTLPPRYQLVPFTPLINSSSSHSTTHDIKSTTSRAATPSQTDKLPSNRASAQTASRVSTPRLSAQPLDIVRPPVNGAPTQHVPSASASMAQLPHNHPKGADTIEGDLPAFTALDSGSMDKVASEEIIPDLQPLQESPGVHSSPTSTAAPQSSTTGPTETVSAGTSPDNDTQTSTTLEIEAGKTEPRLTEPQTPINVRYPVHKVSISSIDVEMKDIDPATAFETPRQPNRESRVGSSDTVRPRISINTQMNDHKLAICNQDNTIVETPLEINTLKMDKITPASTPVSDPTRRATRISSGVLLKKSVSEILGETPKPVVAQTDTSVLSRDKDKKQKEKSQLSTVVFAKPARTDDDGDHGGDNTDLTILTKHTEKDYMYTLFESKALTQNRQGPLSSLLQNAHKTINTSDWLTEHHHSSQCRTLKRIYQLQNLDRWGLRQRKRVEEPVRSTTHWDFLLDHARWMRMDFREERRWKMAVARDLAEKCAEYVNASVQKRITLRLQTKLSYASGTNESRIDQMESPIPDLDAHDDDDSVIDELAEPTELLDSAPPAAIFSLGPAEYSFMTQKTTAFDKIIGELPLYEPVQIVPDPSKSDLAEKLDAKWKTEIVPVSRWATEKLKEPDRVPVFKRSRYDYELDDSPKGKLSALEPRETNVGLFMAEHKHIRDRIHPGFAFRPPADHPMPTQAFFENRISSQWLNHDDDEVKKYAREYSFNWLLISDLLTPPTLYTSGQDRRSPWECFERWIGLEGMPADMSKTQYFKTYSSRIETAQRNVQALFEEMERRAPPNTPVAPRRRTTLPVHVERKHNRRHLFMLDAMRRLAKKRENARQKQAHSADAAAVRKSNDQNLVRVPARSIAEWTQVKFERLQSEAKQHEKFVQQMRAHQMAAKQQRGQSSSISHPMPMPNHITPQFRVPAVNGVPVPGMPGTHMSMQGQPRAHPNMMNMPGHLPPNMMPKLTPQQIQAIQTGALNGSPQQQAILRRAQAQVAAATAQQSGVHSSPGVPQANMVNGASMSSATQAYLAALSQANGQASPSAGINGNAASPRPHSSHTQSLSSGSIPKINQLFTQYKERNPHLSDEEIKTLATQQLIAYQQQATAAALGSGRPKTAMSNAVVAPNGVNYVAQNAAAVMNNVAMNASTPGTNQGAQMSYEQAQQYHARLRAQQAQQNAARGSQVPLAPGQMSSNGMNGSVMNMIRPGSQQGTNSQVVRQNRHGSGNHANLSLNLNGLNGSPALQQQMLAQQQAQQSNVGTPGAVRTPMVQQTQQVQQVPHHGSPRPPGTPLQQQTTL